MASACCAESFDWLEVAAVGLDLGDRRPVAARPGIESRSRAQTSLSKIEPALGKVR